MAEIPSSASALRNRLRLHEPGSYYQSASGGLGFGICAGVGVQLAEPDRPVVCVVGEGSAQYGITVLWTAVAYKVPVTFLVLRNTEYMILKWFAEFEQVTGASGARAPGAGHGRGGAGLRDAGGERFEPRTARRGAPRSDPRGRRPSPDRGAGRVRDVVRVAGAQRFLPAAFGGRGVGRLLVLLGLLAVLDAVDLIAEQLPRDVRGLVLVAVAALEERPPLRAQVAWLRARGGSSAWTA